MIFGIDPVRSIALKTVNARETLPPASTTPVVEKSSNQPIRSGVYGRLNDRIGVDPFAASVISGKAPRTLPTDFEPPPKLMLRRFVSSAAEATGGKVCSRS